MSKFDPKEFFAADRVEKLRQLRDRGINPYPPEFHPSSSIGAFVEQYEEQDVINDTSTHQLAGRVVRINDLGGLAFVEIADQSDSVQLFLTEDTEGYEYIDELDLIDFLGATGQAGRSNTDELQLEADSLTVLTKSLNHHHPPNKEEVGDKYEKRGVKMWWDEVRQPLETRFQITREIRRYLDDQGFLEVETPVLQNVAGGAEATPFETHLEEKDEEMYLRIATELHLKRMVVGGFEKIYEIGPVFRNEGIDPTHNPEYTQLELYEAYSDYTDMMQITEDLVAHLLEEFNNGDSTLVYQKPVRDENGEVRTDEENNPITEPVELDFSTPWRRMAMEEAIEEYSDGEIVVEEYSDEELKELAQDYDVDFPGGYSRGLGIEGLFEAVAEHRIDDPTFIIDHPTETTPLCKDHREKEDRIERFELFIAGAEYANAYTELNDPIRQGEHFADQADRREAGDEEAHQMDTDFLTHIGHGLPPTGGLGIGIGRLAMLFTDRQTIKDVIAFPIRGEKE